MADINTGGTGEGRGPNDPSLFESHLRSRATGGFSEESTGELDSFIRSSGRAKSSLQELQKLMAGDGKAKVSEFTNAFKKLNAELDRAVKSLDKIQEGAKGIPGGLGGTGGGGGSYTAGHLQGLPSEEQRSTYAVDSDSKSSTAIDPATGLAIGAGAGMQKKENGGSGAFRGVMRAGAAIGGVGFSVGMAGASMVERQRASVGYADILARQSMATGGSLTSWSEQYKGMMLRGNYSGMEEFQGAEQVLRTAGVGPGTETHTRMLRDVGGLLHARPDASGGQLAGLATTLQHGNVARDLRLRGATSWDQSTPDQMRSILRYAAGGQDPSSGLLQRAAPGTPYYQNVLALLGNDPGMANEVLQFGRADARGRRTGADVTTRRGAAQVFGESVLGEERAAGGSRAADSWARLEEVGDRLRTMSNRSEQFSDALRDSSHWVAEFGRVVRGATEDFGTYFGWVNRLGEALGGITTGLAAFGGFKALKGMFSGGGGAAAKGAFGRATAAVSNSTIGNAVGVGVLNARSAASSAWRGVASGAGTLLTGLGWGLSNRSMTGHPVWGFEDDPAVQQQMARDQLRHLRTLDDEQRAQMESFLDTEELQRVASGEPAGGLTSGIDHRLVRGADHEGEGYSERGFGGVKSHVAKAGNFIKEKFGPFPGGIGGRGSRPGNPTSDHPQGLALDFMTMNNKALGNRVSNYMVKNAKHFGVKYVIWDQKINSLDGRGWRRMEDRGSKTANHEDHPHVSFEAFSGMPGSAEDLSEESPGGKRSSGARGMLGGSGSYGRNERTIFDEFFGGLFNQSLAAAVEGEAPGQGRSDRDDSGRQYTGEFSGDPSEIAKVAARAGWTGQDLVTAVAVALAESRGNPRANAAGSEDSRGLWQINSVHHDRFDPNQLYDPQYNADAAYKLWTARPNWADWSVHPNSANYTPGNSFRNFMGTAREAVSSLQGQSYSGGDVVEPAGGLTSSDAAASAAPVGHASPIGGASSGGGARSVNVNIKIDRASYDEAEKFAEWVMGFMKRDDDLHVVGGR